MFGKQVGHYHWTSLYCYFVPHKNAKIQLEEFLPNTRHIYYFNKARHGIYRIIYELKCENPNLSVAIPNWTCSIIYSVLLSLKVSIQLVDIDPDTLKMDIDELCARRPDVVILVSENGNIYENEEIFNLKNSGVITIGDYCLALRNYLFLKNSHCDFSVFSGGFSKPVSSFGLGIVCCNYSLSAKTKFVKNFNLIDMLRLIAHKLIQNTSLYNILSYIFPTSQIEVFKNIRNNNVNVRNIAVLDNEFSRFRSEENDFMDFQNTVLDCLKLPRSKYFKTKIVTNRIHLNDRCGIDFHKQYSWSSKFISKGEPTGLIKIINAYISISINKVAVKRKNNFIYKLEKIIQK